MPYDPTLSSTAIIESDLISLNILNHKVEGIEFKDSFCFTKDICMKNLPIIGIKNSYTVFGAGTPLGLFVPNYSVTQSYDIISTLFDQKLIDNHMFALFLHKSRESINTSTLTLGGYDKQYIEPVDGSDENGIFWNVLDPRSVKNYALTL